MERDPIYRKGMKLQQETTQGDGTVQSEKVIFPVCTVQIEDFVDYSELYDIVSHSNFMSQSPLANATKRGMDSGSVWKVKRHQ